MTASSLVDDYQHFGGSYYLYLQENRPLVNVSDHLPDYIQCYNPQDRNLHIVFKLIVQKC